jgi:predicted homoserine dehydrogenase-like protein
MARGIANQIINSVPGMELVAISNRHVPRAGRAYGEASRDDFVEASTLSQVRDALKKGQPVVTGDAFLSCDAEGIDAIVDATGAIEFGAHITLRAIEARTS